MWEWIDGFLIESMEYVAIMEKAENEAGEAYPRIEVFMKLCRAVLFGTFWGMAIVIMFLVLTNRCHL